MLTHLPQIGSYQLTGCLILAPMAGVTDRPQRELCRRFGAALAVSEMVTSDINLWSSNKSRHRLLNQEDLEPRSVQIAGTEPKQMADAARANVALGAQIIDINMGCPAKKVCNKAAGSALMKDEQLVEQILKAVVEAVDVPVTLKMRTGWCSNNKNALAIAQIAEACDIKAITIHGRTREDLYKGSAEYDTIAEVKQRVNIPVFANGDINTPDKAKYVLNYTKVDALMIGRAAQGNPWLFREINYFLKTGKYYPSPSLAERQQIMLEHLQALHELYGNELGVRIARKHIGWYLSHITNVAAFKQTFNQLESTIEQLDYIKNIFTQLAF